MRRLQGLGFVVVCVLSGSQWIVESAFPSTLPALVRESVHYAVIALVAGTIWIIRTRTTVRDAVAWVRVGAAGLLLLGVPTLLNEVGRVVVRQSGAALFALAPLFVVVGAAAYGSHAGVRALMAPALLGFGGGLLLLSFQLPATGYGGLQFAVVFAAVLLTAVGSVWLHVLLQACDIVLTVAGMSGVNAVFLGCAAALRGGGLPSISALTAELVRSVVLDLPVVFLLIWLVREVSPERLAARFLVVPLVATVEGVILLHVAIGLRTGLGMLLMVAASGALLFRGEADDSKDVGQLGLR